MKKRVVSGIQPTGILHLGNYLGAVKKWVSYQQDNQECFYFIADHHSNTLKLLEKIEEIHNNTGLPPDPRFKEKDNLDDYCIKTAACLLASGIDPKKSCLFIQSQIPQHTELMWILSCITPISWLNRMIQFKEKRNKLDNLNSAGLFTYPILMSADILLYKAQEVPVGQDQLQHIQITRDLAERINKLVNKKILIVPEYTQTDYSKVMSLQNGTKKMSKSDKAKLSTITMVDGQEQLQEKIIKAKTDTFLEIFYDTEKRPEVSNLISIYCALENIKLTEFEKKFEKANLLEFKKELVKSLEKHFLPLCEKTHKLIKSENDYILDVLNEGKKRATVEAKETLDLIKSEFNYL